MSVNSCITCLAPLMALCLIGCGSTDSTNTNPTPSVRGLNLTGVWRWGGVECYRSSLNNRTAVAILTSESYRSSITINGNSGTGQAIGSDGCVVTYSYNIVANLIEGDTTGGYGTYTTSTTTARTSTQSSCTLRASLNVTQGSISPTTITTT